MLSAGRSVTTSELAEKLSELEPDKDVSIRQIQRDMQALREAGVPIVDRLEGHLHRLSIPAYARMAFKPLHIHEQELLSLHVLKGALAAFTNTRVKRDVEHLIAELEAIVPGTVFLREDVLSEVSPGRFTTAISDTAMEAIINAIVDPHWDRVTYRAMQADTAKTFVVSFCRLIDHAGRLYVAAWHPVHAQYITLAADRIEHVERANDITDPIHVFDEGAYRRARFGVFDGDLVDVELLIDASAADFFTGRMWHPSQTFDAPLPSGDVMMRMRVPLSPELISWLVSWADVMRIVGPSSVVEACRAKVSRIGERL
jgi:predicted DNA-binding transcriptional regulator YafY